ncbi:MAG: hypothetical protein ACE5E4_08125 [Candidatus Binatia bacterium]
MTEYRDPQAIVPKLFVILIAVFLTIPALFQIAIELRNGESVYVTELWRHVPTEPFLREFEATLDEGMELANRIRPPYAALLDRYFRRGNEKVVMGLDDWLFLDESLRYIQERPPSFARGSTGEDPAAVIIDFHRQVQAAGGQLVVVPVPVKPTVHAEKLAAGIAPDLAPNYRGFSDIIGELHRAGVVVVELGPTLLEVKNRGDAAYLPRDTHWSPLGVKAAAAEVARRLSALPAFEQLERGGVRFSHRLIDFTGTGDLYDMLAYAESGAQVPPMEYRVEQIVASPHGPAPTGDRGSPIVLLGDSYSAVYSEPALGLGRHAGFAEHLADELGIPLDVIAVPGGGAHRARDAFALRGSSLRSKRIIVWQFSERELGPSATGWKRISFSTAEVRAGSVQGEGLRVRARLTGISRLPDDLNYPDCLIMLRYKALQPRAKTEEPLYVAVWGQRGWEPVAANRDFAVEDVHELSLVPLRERYDIEKTCWADDVGVDRSPWWAESLRRVGPSP